MQHSTTTKRKALIAFVCPACTVQNEVDLIALARAGAVNCVSCKRRLRSQDVSRAIHSPRKV